MIFYGTAIMATRYLDYAFELENGIYEIEVGFCDPWGCSASPSIYANLGKENEVVIAENNEVKDQPLYSYEMIENRNLVERLNTNYSNNGSSDRLR